MKIHLPVRRKPDSSAFVPPGFPAGKTTGVGEMLKRIKNIAATVTKLMCGLICCTSLTAADILSDSTQEDPAGIRRLTPSPDILLDIQHLASFVKLFHPRLFSGEATENDIQKLLALLKDDINSDELLGIAITIAHNNPERADFFFAELEKLASANPDSPYLNAVAGERFFPDVTKKDKALFHLSNAFRVMSSSGELPAQGTFARTVMTSAFTKLIALYSSQSMDKEEEELLAYLEKTPELAKDPVLIRDLLVCRHIAYSSYRQPPAVLGVPISNAKEAPQET